ncbi:MAG TPA: amidohydrolase family protein [Sedimentibacter sp.]|nr:amidohydrolase family protein [Sedimentibacter sp.]
MQVKFYKANYIIVWDENQHKTLEKGYLAVKGDRIEGFYSEIPEGAEYEDLGNAAIIPGFINTHCHPCESYCLKSYREDIGNPCFYESTLYDYALVMAFDEKWSVIQSKLNLMEILKSGVTTAVIFGGGYSRQEAEIAGNYGMRAYVGGPVRAGDPKEEKSIWSSPDGHSINYNFDEESGMKRIDEAEQFIKEYQGLYDGRVNALWGPTQTMTCTPKMLREIRKRADKMGIGITIHGAESPIEFESCIRTYGKTPVQYMADTGMLGEDVIVAHCLYIQGHSGINMAGKQDLKLIGDSRTTVAHCPWVLARSGNSLQSFQKYTEAGVNLTIGTDTFPSDFIQEMRHAAWMGKAAGRSTFAMSARDVFNAATINGAKALGRNDLGKLEKGSKADFVVFSLDNIEMSPVRDVIKNIVYSATRHSVDRVYVDGICVVKDGEIPGVNEKDLVRELQETTELAWSKTAKYDRSNRSVDALSPLAAPKYVAK